MPLLALSKLASGVMAAVGAVIFLAAAGYILNRSAWRRRELGEERPDIPPAMRPGPSDPDLEKPLLERLQGWGILLVAFFVVWIPLYWLKDPSSNLAQEKTFETQSIERGKNDVQWFSEENPGGMACVRCHGPNLQGGLNMFDAGQGPAVVPVPKLTDVCGGASTGHGAIKSLDDVRNTIMQGRPGTDMPSWSIRYQGALDDQQIDDIVNYLLSIQKVPFDRNVCINPKAGSPTPAPSGAVSATPSAPPSESPSP